MIVSSRAVLSLSGLIVGYCACGGAQAGDLSAQAAARAEALCAAYGPGFRAMEGGDACVFVGGRLRVGFGSRGAEAPNNGWASGSAVPVNAAGGAGLAGHLRVPAGDAPGTIAR
jgi:hypothetical protein